MSEPGPISVMLQDPLSGRIQPKLNVASNGSTTEVECDKASNYATGEDSLNETDRTKLDGH